MTAVVAGSGIASAHSRPVRFDPAPGAILESSPARITGWFTSDIRRAPESFIRVLDSSGKRVDSGDVVLSSDRRQMSVAVNAGQPGGQYLVHWSTFDDGDGEVFAGCHMIFVGQTAADAATSKGTALDGGSACPANAESEGVSMASIALDVPDHVDGSSVTLHISPTSFTPRAPTGSGQEDGFGHYHIYLDKVPLDVLTGHTHDEMTSDMSSHDEMTGHMGDANATENEGGLAENPVMWVDNSYTFKDLSPGTHTVSVALFHDDHSPYSPPVVESRTFTVGGDSGDGVPLWTLVLGVVAGLAAGAGAFSLIKGRS